MLQMDLNAQFVGNHSDEFTVGGLSAAVLNGIAEIGVEHINIASVPGDFDRVADGTFDARRRGAECLGNLGVQYLRNGIRVPDGPRRGFPKSAICR